MALEARIKTLTAQLDQLRKEALGVDETSSAYQQLLQYRRR